MNFPVGYTLDDQNFVEAHLEPDEELVWTAKPQPRLFGAGRWVFLLVASFICFQSGLFYVLIVKNTNISWLFWLPIGMVFFAVILVMLVPMCLRASERKKIYVLTNRRALVLHPSNRALRGEWSGDSLVVLDIKQRGAWGDVVLSRRQGLKTYNDRPANCNGFIDIENPSQVAQLVKECAAQGLIYEAQKIEAAIHSSAHDTTVPAPTGEDEVNAAAWLSSGERLLWVGHPHVRTWTQGTIAVSLLGMIILMGLYVGSEFVSNFIEDIFRSSNMAAYLLYGMLILLLLVGIRCLGASRWRRNRSSKTLYILTDKNAIVVKPHWLKGTMTKVHTWNLATHPIKKVAESSYRGGHDIIWSYNKYITLNNQPLAEGFLDMESVEKPLAVLSKIPDLNQVDTLFS